MRPADRPTDWTAKKRNESALPPALAPPPPPPPPPLPPPVVGNTGILYEEAVATHAEAAAVGKEGRS